MWMVALPIYECLVYQLIANDKEIDEQAFRSSFPTKGVALVNISYLCIFVSNIALQRL